jgi:hypothetical protein
MANTMIAAGIPKDKMFTHAGIETNVSFAFHNFISPHLQEQTGARSPSIGCGTALNLR